MQYSANLAEDFIERTFAIIRQYDELRICDKEKYEITLRMNCLFGLIIVPKAIYYNSLSFSIDKKGKYYEIKVNGDKKQEKVKAQIVMHCLRNGLAHWMEMSGGSESNNVEFYYNEDREISKIKLRGKGRVEKTEYDVEVNINKVPEGIDEFLRKIHKNIGERK